MVLKYREPHFWKTFHKRYWLPQIPTVIRNPFRDFPFTEELLLRALTTFEEGLRNGDYRKHCLVSIGDSETAPRRPLRSLFRNRHESMEDLEESCSALFPKKRFGLMVTQIHAVDPGIWNGLTSFLRDGRKWIGFPPRAFADLFYGNYTSTFTGVHKDKQEIFAFVVRGEKRILAWPFDYFLTRTSGLSFADRYFNKRLSVDPRKFRKDAVILDATPGDLIYWPSGYWHVSEPQSDRFSAMISMGLFRQEIALASPEKSSRDTARQFRWRTGYGFELGGPIRERPLHLFKTDTVVKSKNSEILWKRQEGKLLVSSNGHSMTLPYSPQTLQLLEKLSQSKPVHVPSTRHLRTTKISETTWNRRCELTTRQLTSHYSSPATLIAWLLRVHAVQ